MVATLPCSTIAALLSPLVPLLSCPILAASSGVLLSADGRGIWLRHNVPGYPTSLLDSGYFPLTGLSGSATFLCLNLTSDDVDVVRRDILPVIGTLKVPTVSRAGALGVVSAPALCNGEGQARAACVLSPQEALTASRALVFARRKVVCMLTAQSGCTCGAGCAALYVSHERLHYGCLVPPVPGTRLSRCTEFHVVVQPRQSNAARQLCCPPSPPPPMCHVLSCAVWVYVCVSWCVFVNQTNTTSRIRTSGGSTHPWRGSRSLGPRTLAASRHRSGPGPGPLGPSTPLTCSRTWQALSAHPCCTRRPTAAQAYHWAAQHRVL